MDAIELRQIPARPALVARASCPPAAIGQTIQKLFCDVGTWAEAHGVALAGPAVARYLRASETDGFDVEAGFVVAAPAAGDADVRAVDLGGCRAVCATHIGAYESLRETYAALERWMADKGLRAAGPVWEEYFSAPETPPAETRTDVCWPVA